MTPPRLAGGPAAVAALLIAAAPARAAAPDGLALLKTYCADCHADGRRSGGFDLDGLLAAKADPAARRQWEKVWKTVRHEFMPPAHADLPPAADRLAVAVPDHDLDHLAYEDADKAVADTGWWELHDRTERRTVFTLHGRTGSVRYALIRTDRDWLLHRTKEQPPA